MHYQLGVFSLERAEYADAEDELLKSKAEYSTLYFKTHLVVASVLSRLAVLYAEQSRYKEAVAAATQQKNIYELALGYDDKYTALATVAIAEYTMAAGDTAQAARLVRYIKSPLVAGFGEKSYEAIRLQKLQGDIELAKEEYRDAEQTYSKALEPLHSVTDSRMFLRGKIELERARTRSILAEEDSAIDDIRLAEYDFGHSRASAFPLAAKCKLVEGVISEQRNKLDSAFIAYNSALKIYKAAATENFSYTSERERLLFIRDINENSGRVFSTVMRAAALHPSGSATAYDWLLFQKGAVLSSLLAIRAATKAQNDDVAATILQRISELSSRRSALRGGGNLLIARPLQTADSLDRIIEDLEKKLARRSQLFHHSKTIGVHRWMDVEHQLPADACAIELASFHYFDGERRTDTSLYAAFMTDGRNKKYPKTVMIGTSQTIEDPSVRREYYRSLERASPDRRKTLLLVSRLLWSPIETLTDTFKTVYLSPDGLYSQISLASLPLNEKYDLVDKYHLVTVANTGDILRDSLDTLIRSITIFADPKYDSASTTDILPVTAETRDDHLLKALPGTRVEAHNIASLFKNDNWSVNTYLGDNATEEYLSQLRHQDIIHIATHATFDHSIVDSEQTITQELLNCSLYLAGANETLRHGSDDPENDGVISGLEAMYLPFEGTDLVTLSACESGRGHIEPGEGVFGLPRALRTAGARNILMSLWHVPDRETSELMTFFYRSLLRKSSKADALRNAELQERQVVRKRYGEDIPLYWGGFVLIGF